MEIFEQKTKKVHIDVDNIDIFRANHRLNKEWNAWKARHGLKDGRFPKAGEMELIIEDEF